MDNNKKSKEVLDEKLINELREEFAKLTVKDFLSQTLATISTLAYQKMGIPSSCLQYKDLDQAKLAIDAFAELFKTLQSSMDQREIDAFNEVLTQMRIEFVKKSNESDT